MRLKKRREKADFAYIPILRIKIFKPRGMHRGYWWESQKERDH
jgi:hypothetical protein